MKILLTTLLPLFLLSSLGECLRCYVCDNQGSGKACEKDPGAVPNAAKTCVDPNDQFCYVSRIDKTTPTGDEELIINRGCCRVRKASLICPEELDEYLNMTLTEANNNGAKTSLQLSKCAEDLCNTSDGTKDGGKDDEGGNGNVVVEGVLNMQTTIRPSVLLIIALTLTFTLKTTAKIYP